jgi:capsular polysaccharide biosynthesis protein
MKQPKNSAGRPVRRSIAVGLLLALMALAGGVTLAVTQQQAWIAESVMVVLPRANLDDATSAAFYETMSRGQIVGTFAEVADNPSFQRQAMNDLQLTAAQKKTVSTTVSVVPDTSVILVRVSAGTPAAAEQVTDATAALASRNLASLSNAYRTQIVHSAQGTAAPSGTSPTLLLILSAGVALVAGVATQQAVYHLVMARRQTTVVSASEGLPLPEAIEPAAQELSHAGRS